MGVTLPPEPADPFAVSTCSLAGALACHQKATELDGSLYIFAQNIDPQNRAGKATITVEGLPAGTAVQVVDENRAITSQAGQFTDDFAPLAEHVYRLPR